MMPESESPSERLAPAEMPPAEPATAPRGRLSSATAQRSGWFRRLGALRPRRFSRLSLRTRGSLRVLTSLPALWRRIPRWALALAAGAALAISSLVVPAQWLGRITPGESLVDSGAVAVKRGSALDTSDRVWVDGLEVFDSDGEILFTTVAVDSSVTVWEWLQSGFVDHMELRSREEVFGSRTPDEQRLHNLALMQSSKDAAVIAALETLGVQAVDEAGIGFASVVEGGPVAGLIEPGEVIVGLDGNPITSLESLRAVLDAVEPGDPAVLTVEELPSGTRRSVDFVYGSHPDGLDGGFIGIADVVVRVADLDLPFDIAIDSGSIGGPSAGLAFALTIIDLLTEGELTGGARVAATGTISPGGAVGDVGGVAQKAAAAERAGVDLLLVPVGTLNEALDSPAEVEVAGVASLAEALDVLAGLGGDVDQLALELPTAS